MKNKELKTETWQQVKDYSDILMQAAIIAKDRQAQYGEATESIALACRILDETFNMKLTPLQFCYVMVALKLSRQKYKFKKDNIIDAINYLAIGIASEDFKNEIKKPTKVI